MTIVALETVQVSSPSALKTIEPWFGYWVTQDLTTEVGIGG